MADFKQRQMSTAKRQSIALKNLYNPLNSENLINF